MTLNELEGHSQFADVSNAIGRAFVQHFTLFQLTVCSLSLCVTKFEVSSVIRFKDIQWIPKFDTRSCGLCH